MKVLKKSQLKNISMGYTFLIYAPTKVGKTETVLLTAPDPILHINTDPRGSDPMIIDKYRPDLKYDTALYEGSISGFLEFLTKVQLLTKSY